MDDEAPDHGRMSIETLSGANPAGGTTAKPKALIGASIPRSGHHFLQTLLSAYFHGEMFYCEYYTPPNCCKQFPCTRRGQQTINFQKSHDRDHDVPMDIKDAMYIIQYRHPVPEALSDRELDLSDSIGRRSINHRSSREYFMQWLAEKAIYYRKFHDRWFANRVPNAYYLDYEVLSADPGTAMRKIINWSYGRVDEARLSAQMAEISATRVSAPHMQQPDAAFKPRVVQDSKYFDADLLGALEDYVIKRCPHFGFERMLTGSYENHPLYGLIMMYDDDEPLPAGERNRINAVARLTPEHPEVRARLAQKALRKGDVEATIPALHELVQRYPYYAGGYRLLFAAYKKLERVPPWEVVPGNGILACAENMELLTELGATYLAQGRNVAAVAALAAATTIGTEHKRANQLFAEALAGQRRWGQAEQYANKAAQIEPRDGSTDELLDRIRSRRSR